VVRGKVDGTTGRRPLMGAIVVEVVDVDVVDTVGRVTRE
jgi:hypothetical protein